MGPRRPFHEFLPHKHRLSDRQLECLTWVALGKTDKEIASILGLKQQTVHNHIERAKRRIGTQTRVFAAFIAFQLGLITLPYPHKQYDDFRDQIVGK